MKRLFTFGCSFTQWWWPTWADLIAPSYDHFENWAIKGCGNRTIAERLSEFLLQNDITEDDTIIVQWTDYHRHDIHMDRARPGSNWSSSGGIWTNKFTPEWVKEYWTEPSYIMHSLNFINFGINLLENQPCKWYMTTYIELQSEIEPYPQMHFYKKIFEHPNWVNPPIQEYTTLLGYTYTDFNCSFLDRDHHPSPEYYALWLEHCLLSKLEVSIDYDYLNKINQDFKFIQNMSDDEERSSQTIWPVSRWYMDRDLKFGL
jgi:hypothetical protein